MNLPYRQQVRQLRGNVDWSWEQPGPRIWVRRPPDQLPPISWGGGHGREDLVQDRLHAQNLTWSDDSSSSFYTLSDHDSGSELDLGEEGLLELLEQGEAPVPIEPVPRGPRGRPLFTPGSRPGRGRGPLQPRLTRRADWWRAPPIPLYTSVYERPRSTAWWNSLTAGQPMTFRSAPAREDRGPDQGGDRTVGTNSPGEAAGGNTGRTHNQVGPVSPPSRAPGCLLGLSRTRLCHSAQEAEASCRPRPAPVWEEDDLVVTRGPGAPLVFRLQHTSW